GLIISGPAELRERKRWLGMNNRTAQGTCSVPTDSPQPSSGERAKVRAKFGPRLPLAHQLLERGFVADRIEVGVAGSKRAEPLRPVDREPEMLDRVGRPPREALAARDIVERRAVLRMGCDQLASAVGSLSVVARLVEAVERHPDLPAQRFVGLPRRAAERNDRRPRLFGERRALDARAGEAERA